MPTTESWQGMIEFVTVVEEGSFSGAARRLAVSVSRISRQVDRLERRLGVALLKRSTRKMRVTEAGRKYAQACGPLIKGLEAADRGLAEDTSQPRGHIRITSGGMFVAQAVTPVLVEFMSLYPEVSIDLDFTPRKVNLIEEGYDLAIRFGALDDSSLTARKLTERRLAVCGSPEYLARHGRPSHPRELDRFTCLAGNVDTWRFDCEDGPCELRVGGRFRCGNPVSQALAAVGGLGLIYVPRFYVESHLAEGTLDTVLDAYVTRDKATWLIYPAHDFLPRATRLLIDYICTSLQK